LASAPFFRRFRSQVQGGFTAGRRPLYLAFKAVSLPPKTVIKGVLIAEDVEDAAPPNSRLAETSVTAADGGNVPGHFKFTLNPAWVPGRLAGQRRPAPSPLGRGMG
jgi:hypothetical protein